MPQNPSIGLMSMHFATRDMLLAIPTTSSFAWNTWLVCWKPLSLWNNGWAPDYFQQHHQTYQTPGNDCYYRQCGKLQSFCSTDQGFYFWHKMLPLENRFLLFHLSTWKGVQLVSLFAFFDKLVTKKLTILHRENSSFL